MKRCTRLPIIVTVSLLFPVFATVADSKPVRDILEIGKGCYPVSYDATKEQIGVVCRGEKNWVPEAVLYFSQFESTSYYTNKLGVNSNLDKDLENDLGYGPWFEYYLKKLDEKGIPRPR